MRLVFSVSSAASLAFALLVLSGCATTNDVNRGAQQVDWKKEIKTNSRLASELMGMAAADRYERAQLIKAVGDSSLSNAEKERRVAEIQLIVSNGDRKRVKEVKEILSEVRIEQLGKIDPRFAQSAFLIIMHSGDVPFQRSQLESAERLAKSGVVDGQVFAILSDKINIQLSLPQRYGTQLICEAGTRRVMGTHETVSIDKARDSIGLDSLSAYVDEANKLYGPCQN